MDHSKTPKTTTSNAYTITTINHSTSTMHHDQAITQKITIRTWTNSPPQQQITQNCTNNIKNSLQIYTNNNNNTNNINKYISQQAITPKSQPTSNKYLHHNKQSLKNHNQHQQIHTITCNHSNLHQHQQKHTHTHTPHNKQSLRITTTYHVPHNFGYTISTLRGKCVVG